jgi:transposase
VRRKYACRTCADGVKVAAAPTKLLLKSNASTTLLTYVATAKYQDALPLYRQSQIFARHGAETPRNILARWMVQTGELIAPLVKTLRRHLLTDGYEGYAGVVRRNGIAHAGCWAHARRKFVEA